MSSTLTSIAAFCLLIITGISTYGQQRETCNCAEIMNFVYQKTENVYAGFSTKVTTENRKDYDKLKQLLMKQAKLTNDIDSCYLLSRRYTAFFKDQHVRTQFNWRYADKYPERMAALNKVLYNGKKMASGVRNTTAFRQLDENTVLLTLPSFEQEYKGVIDSLVKTNEDLLKTIPYLIIDLRNNSGGYDFTYQSLYPFIYSNPFVVYYSEVRVSDDAIALYREGMDNPNLGKETRAFFQRSVEILQKKGTGFVSLSGKRTDTVEISTFFPRPETVVVITDRGTASAAENLVAMARQSKRVIVFGDNTAGAIDYGDIAWLNPPAFPSLELLIPTQRSCRLPEMPVDNIGFAPDVYVPVDRDAYEYIREWLKKERPGEKSMFRKKR